MKENYFLVNLLQREFWGKDFYFGIFFWMRSSGHGKILNFLSVHIRCDIFGYLPYNLECMIFKHSYNLLIWPFSFFFQKVNLLNLTQCEWTLPLPLLLATTDQESKTSKVQFIEYEFNPPVLHTGGLYFIELLNILPFKLNSKNLSLGQTDARIWEISGRVLGYVIFGCCGVSRR